MKTLFAPAAAFLVIATAAIAQPEGSPEPDNQTTAKSEEKDDRLVCRWVQDSDVGSLIRGRTRRCLTAAQWQALGGRR